MARAEKILVRFVNGTACALTSPGREAYDESVKVSGKEHDVDAAIEELSNRVASLNTEEKIEVVFPVYMCGYFRAGQLDERLREIGLKHGIRLTACPLACD